MMPSTVKAHIADFAQCGALAPPIHPAGPGTQPGKPPGPANPGCPGCAKPAAKALAEPKHNSAANTATVGLRAFVFFLFRHTASLVKQK
jgi:hypothetical protein